MPGQKTTVPPAIGRGPRVDIGGLFGGCHKNRCTRSDEDERTASRPRVEITLMSQVPLPRLLNEENRGERTHVDGAHGCNVDSRFVAEPAGLQDDHLGLRALLDDPVLEDWASEIAWIYRVSPLDVLEALALVLVRDGK
jgi:hypothetical protein